MGGYRIGGLAVPARRQIREWGNSTDLRATALELITETRIFF